MIKLIAALAILALGLGQAGAAQGPKNYIVTIDGQDVEINLGDTVTAKTKSGTALSVALKRKAFATFESGPLRFEYRGDLSVASTNLDSDIHQHLVASAVGTLLIVQQYDKINPALLTDFMLKQMTDGDVAASAKLQSTAFSTKLVDGTVMTGVRASIKSDKDDVSLQVMAADTGIGGVMAISRINNDFAKNEQAIVDRFWATLKVKN